MSNIVTISGLEKTYTTGNEKLSILKNLDFVVEEGSKTIIIGESGSGKSTLLNIIGSIDKATAGTVIAGPWNVTELNEQEQALYRQNFLGLIFQFHYLLKDFTALENVYMASYMAGNTKKQAVERAKTLLCDVGLENRMNAKVGLLSGGQRQALTLLMATLQKPKILLLDEHTAALDPKTAKKVLDLTETFVKQDNLTTFMVTHNMKDAIRYGNRLIMMMDGRIVYDVRGEEKQKLTVEDLLEKFSVSGVVSDKLLG